MAGQSETGCVCSASQVTGVRSCMKNLIWSACSCPTSTKAEACKEGDPVTCPLCPGETVGRTTMCLQSGTYDCPACGASGAAGRRGN